jgi:hypothetical protein
VALDLLQFDFLFITQYINSRSLKPADIILDSLIVWELFVVIKSIIVVLESLVIGVGLLISCSNFKGLKEMHCGDSFMHG